jgi:hypothetical protein
VKQLGSLFTSITSTFTETTQQNSNIPSAHLSITSSSLKLLFKPIKASLATSLHVPLNINTDLPFMASLFTFMLSFGEVTFSNYIKEQIIQDQIFLFALIVEI